MNEFIPQNVCPKKIQFTVENDIVKKVIFDGGCPGNLEAISRLVQDLPVDKVIDLLKGISCGSKSTSCSDQLAIALANAKNEAKTQA